MPSDVCIPPGIAFGILGSNTSVLPAGRMGRLSRLWPKCLNDFLAGLLILRVSVAGIHLGRYHSPEHLVQIVSLFVGTFGGDVRAEAAISADDAVGNLAVILFIVKQGRSPLLLTPQRFPVATLALSLGLPY